MRTLIQTYKLSTLTDLLLIARCGMEVSAHGVNLARKLIMMAPAIICFNIKVNGEVKPGDFNVLHLIKPSVTCNLSEVWYA